MKIGISLITNRPDKTKRFLSTLKNTIIQGYEFVIGINFQSPFTPDLITEMLLDIEIKWRWVFNESYKDEKGLINFAQARLDSFKLLEDCDFIFMCDDDFEFKDSNRKCGYSSADRLKDCIEFMEKNPSCGLVRQCGFLGGSGFGRTITLSKNKIFDTSKGFLIRNDSNLIDERLAAPGAFEDHMICFTKIMNGFGVYNAFNSPTVKDKTTKVHDPFQSQGELIPHEKPSYDINILKRTGFFKAHHILFGEEFVSSPSKNYLAWKLPRELVEMYLVAAKEKQFEPVYTMKFYRYKDKR